jgi:hypothetical protein
VEFPVEFGAAQVEGLPDALARPALARQPLNGAIFCVALDGLVHRRVILAARAVTRRQPIKVALLSDLAWAALLAYIQAPRSFLTGHPAFQSSLTDGD